MTGHLTDKSRNNSQEPTWINLDLPAQNDFKVPLNGISMNNYPMEGTDSQYQAFIDSGTTFTYVNSENYEAIKKHFNWFCSIDPKNHCKGRLRFEREGYLCFSYDMQEFPDGPYDYFRSFPILKFELGAYTGKNGSYSLEWYPSEYLYRKKKD